MTPIEDCKYEEGGHPQVYIGHTLRVHVPHCYVLGPNSPDIGGTLRPKYSLFGTWTPKP